MSLAFGPQFIAIPGPSPVPDRVQRAMHRASPDIYGEELPKLNAQLMVNLKRLAGTKAHLAPYIGNGHTGWEAVGANIFAPGDHALVLTSGHFGNSWANQMAEMGVAVEVMNFGLAPADPDRLAERLAQDPEGQIRAVMLCQTDTASSAAADIPAMRAAMKDHPALLVVDAIASLGCSPMFMDEWGVDVLISASQKGLMSPPGVALVWFSDRAAARGSTSLTTPLWDWHRRAAAEAPWQFWCGTPPVQHIFGMNEALTMLLDDEGLEAVWARHAALAEAVWAAVEAWGASNPDIRLTISDPARRANSVTALSLPRASELRQWTSSNTGVTLGVGLGATDPDHAMRIAHMGFCNAGMMMASLGAMEAGMAALSIHRGRGALDAAADVIAARVTSG